MLTLKNLRKIVKQQFWCSKVAYQNEKAKLKKKSINLKTALDEQV